MCMDDLYLVTIMSLDEIFEPSLTRRVLTSVTVVDDTDVPCPVGLSCLGCLLS